jgi:hypothetical protein
MPRIAAFITLDPISGHDVRTPGQDRWSPPRNSREQCDQQNGVALASRATVDDDDANQRW